MKRYLTAVISAQLILTVICAVLPVTGGKTTGTEAIIMGVAGLTTLVVILLAARYLWRQP